MRDKNWKDALWKALDILRLNRISARVALSAGLISLASQSAPGAVAQPRVPVSPVLTPEATVRRMKGRYVLRRVANALTVRFMSHRSHSSHASHSSHVSHYSSSAPAPTLVPAPAPPPTLTEPSLPRSPLRKPIPAPKPLPLMKEDFDDSVRDESRWRIGVLATAPDTFDPSITSKQSDGVLSVVPLAHKNGSHFGGYVSTDTFDLNTVTIVVEIRRPASGATTIVAAAHDDINWSGFKIEDGHLGIESHTNGHVVVGRRVPYDRSAHRYLRLRTSKVAPVVVWETSADGTSWNPEYVETSSLDLRALHIALSAGTTKSASPRPAAFGSVLVERKP